MDNIQSTSDNPGRFLSVFYHNKYLLSLSIIILLVAGLSALKNLPRIEDPRIDNRNVIAITAYPGASAKRVEALVTDVIEDELRQLHEIKEIKSTSRAGISIIFIELQDWVNNQTNEGIFSKIRDRLREASTRIPEAAGDIRLDTQRGATAFTTKIALIPKTTEQLALATRLSEELSDKLRNLAGTEIVRSYGGVQEEVRVSFEPQQLAEVGLSLRQVANVIAGNDAKTPSGMIYGGGNNTRVQVATELDSVNTVRNIPVNSIGQGGYVEVGDLATVEKRWRTPISDIALHNGQRVIFVAARMQPTIRVDQWMSSVQQTVDEFEQRFAGSIELTVIFDQSLYTQERLTGLSKNLLLGCAVVMLVILLFMGLRAALIVGAALPLSAAFTVFSLSFYGQQIHQMSVFGIIIAIGLLIDNAIVITDEIRIKLQIPGITRFQALTQSVEHLKIPLLASTLTTVLGFMPIFLLPGNTGDFVSPIAISVVMALLGSLVISLTVIASLAARFLPQKSTLDSKHWYKNGVQVPSITGLFRKHLEWAVNNPMKALISPVVLSLSGFLLLGQLNNVFFPSADRDQFEIYVWLPPGSSIEHTQEVTIALDQMLNKEDTIRQVDWLVGGSFPSVYYNQVMTRDNTPYFSQAVVTAVSADSASMLIDPLQISLTKQFPQAKIVVRAFGQGPPLSAPVGIDLYGPDLEVLQALGNQVQQVMSLVPGITHSITSITNGDPEIIINTSASTSELSGLPFTALAEQLNDGLEGRMAGSILEGTEEIPVRVVLASENELQPWNVEQLPIIVNGNDGQATWLPLNALGESSLQPSLNAITRTNSIRVNRIEGFLQSNATAIDTSNLLMERLDNSDFALPEGYRLKMKGDADKQQEALGQLATYAPVLLVLMIATLILTFSSIKLASIIITVAVLSVGLGFLSLWISGLPLGFNPILASAGLIGVAINGSIVVIAAINADPRAKLGDGKAVVNATMNCTRHILSTTVTTIGGFIPLLLFSAGTFWPPLAVVLAGGVGFSVILSLLFTPVTVATLARMKHKEPPIAVGNGVYQR